MPVTRTSLIGLVAIAFATTTAPAIGLAAPRAKAAPSKREKPSRRRPAKPAKPAPKAPEPTPDPATPDPAATDPAPTASPVTTSPSPELAPADATAPAPTPVTQVVTPPAPPATAKPASSFTRAPASLSTRTNADLGVERTAAPTPTDLDLRLTLSTFLFRESGADAPAIVDQGATLENASPVRRSFGDLRLELSGGGLLADARLRQTTSARFQSGATGGGEYDVRTLAYQLGPKTTRLTLGRQFVDAVGATKVDGLAFTQRLTSLVSATLFGGAFPTLGSRSLDTDYSRIRNADGTAGAHLIPVVGGLGLGYGTPNYHGDVGVAAIYVPQTVPNATSQEASRVFTTASGYWRPAAILDIYHFVLLDVAGANGVALTNGSVGVDVRPTPVLAFTGSINHVSTDVLQISARNTLTDPDPSAQGIVQNNLTVLSVSQDLVRGGATVALAQQRFELSASGGLHRRPAVNVQLADGTGAVAFPAASSGDATFAILDRRSLGGLRVQLAGSLTFPVGSKVANRARGTVVRLTAGRAFAAQKGQLDADIAAMHFTDLAGGGGSCMTSLDVFACYGASDTKAVQAGALVTWRLAREWLLLADAHVGYRDVSSTSVGGMVAWPSVYSVTSFLRLQWRYH